MIRALIFDRDLTLLYLDPARIVHLEHQLRALADTLTFREIFRELERWDGFLPRTAVEEPRLWDEMGRRLAARHRLDEPRRAQLVATLQPYHSYFAAYPDALPALQMLRQKGYRLAILTNSPLPSVERTLSSGGIEPSLFDVIASRASLGVAKPHPDAFCQVAGILGLPTEMCAIVDDQAEHVAAGRACGMWGWVLNRGGSRLDDLVSLSELPGLLEAATLAPPLLSLSKTGEGRARLAQPQGSDVSMAA